MRCLAPACVLVLTCLGANLGRAFETPVSETPKSAPEPGIPVKNQLVVGKCATCHTADAHGNLSRISWLRTTPEGWEEAVKRMVRLNGVVLSPAEAREIVRYLSTAQGLAPEEASPVMYIAERRSIDEQLPTPVEGVCNGCHAYGRAASWRRSKEEWQLLYNMHVGYFPSSELTSFMAPPPPPGSPEPAPGPDLRQPYEKAIEYLTKTFPLQTPEWASFQSTVTAPNVTGRWLVAAHKPGGSPYYGELTVESTADSNLFKTRVRLIAAKNGLPMTREGQMTVYGGYAWRGRSQDTHASDDPTSAKTVREVMMLSRDQSEASGRWIWGDYQEFGLDVKMYRATSGIKVLGLDTPSIALNSAPTVQVFGAGFPTSLSASDLNFGPGVSVKSVSPINPGCLQVTLAVDKAAEPGRRDVSVAGAVLPAAYAVFDHYDYIKVLPDTAVARLGGIKFNKGYVQFEAVAYSNGLDGKPNTADDVPLGPVPATWRMQEFYGVYGDDDMKFVGNINSETGLFTPAHEGPNPERRFARNNYGDVWIEAVVDKNLPPAKVAGDKPKSITGRSYLIVTVPLYARYDQPEVAPESGTH